tara:strand:- start:938 stop:1621 length:684 start_codon:yes stop_codon:yes gene_type:complete
MNKDKFGQMINLNQGIEFLKYENKNKIELIPHLSSIQKTSGSELDSIDFSSSNQEDYKKLDDYKKISDYKHYVKQKNLFNKTVSEYMLTHQSYLNDSDNNKLLNSLLRINDKLIKQASKLRDYLTKIVSVNPTLNNDVNDQKKQLNDSIERLKQNATFMKPLENQNGGKSLSTLLGHWYNIVGIGILILLSIVLLTGKTKYKNSIVLLTFLTIFIFILSWLSRHIIL